MLFKKLQKLLMEFLATCPQYGYMHWLNSGQGE